MLIFVLHELYIRDTMKDATITVRIPRELKIKLNKYGVEISKIVREALEEEVKKRRIKELEIATRKLGEFFAKIPDEEIVKSIRKMRESR